MNNQTKQLINLLQEAQQLIEELDCGPVECSACVDTDDMAYIEVPVDGDGTATSLFNWASAMDVLVGLAHVDWSLGELYTAFQTAVNNTSRIHLPDWEEVEQLMEEESRLRDTYFNLLYFLESPEEYADFLRREVKKLVEGGMDESSAKAVLVSDIAAALQEELEMAKGEKATPRFYQMYQDHIANGGDNFAVWLNKWLEEV